ncbi:MAG: OmpA family protein [Neisseriaceae bacterium]|nr:MAG: OmpA family protein [Neisseriaceae bacterium]
MTEQLKLTAVLLALFASNSMFAAQHNYPGYTETSLTDGKIVKNRYDECWQNSFLETKVPECGGEVVAVPQFEDSVISLSSNFLFGFDKSTLRPEAIQTLNDTAAKITEQGTQVESVVIEGHTDFMGKESYNQALSDRRANSVRDYLISQGVPTEIISAVGYGESQARMTEQCKSQVAGIKNAAKRRSAQIDCIEPDRRVDIKIRATKRIEVEQPTK